MGVCSGVAIKTDALRIRQLTDAELHEQLAQQVEAMGEPEFAAKLCRMGQSSPTSSAFEAVDRRRDRADPNGAVHAGDAEAGMSGVGTTRVRHPATRSAASLGRALTLAVSLDAVGPLLFSSRHLSRLGCRPHDPLRTIHVDRRRDRAEQK